MVMLVVVEVVATSFDAASIGDAVSSISPSAEASARHIRGPLISITPEISSPQEKGIEGDNLPKL